MSDKADKTCVETESTPERVVGDRENRTDQEEDAMGRDGKAATKETHT